MKKSELFFSSMLVPVDYLMIVLAGVSAYNIRFSKFTTDIRPVIFELPFNDYFKALLLISALWIVVFIISGLYNIKGARKLVHEVSKVVLACSTGLMLVVILIFFRRELFDSRFIVLAAWILAIFYVSIARSFVRWLQRRLYRHGIGVKKIIVVGNNKTADNLVHEFSKNKFSGYKVVKRIRDFSLETSHELADFIKDKEIDDIIQADPNLTKAEILRLYDFANNNHIGFRYVADLLEVKVLRTDVSHIAGVPIMEVKRTTLEGWGRITKRIFDVVVSSILITLLSPVYILTTIIIKLDSHGPVFFSKKDNGDPLYRVGQGGKLFKYFKFRSMIDKQDSLRYTQLADQNLRSDGPMVKIKDDPRVTRFGKFIRRWSVDELPELFLVFVGRMSLVGPRPHLPEEVAKYKQHHRKSLTIKPGITGLAQISGRSDLLFEEEVKLDIYYIENWSLLLDLSILIKTPFAVLKHRDTE